MARRTRKVLRLRKLRREREWSQEEVANRVELSPVTICAYEKGTRNPSLGKARALARLFNVSIEELLDEVEVPV